VRGKGCATNAETEGTQREKRRKYRSTAGSKKLMLKGWGASFRSETAGRTFSSVGYKEDKTLASEKGGGVTRGE